MSQLKVDEIVDASGGSNAVLYGPASPAGSMGFRNRIINGAMVIDQRNAGASVSITGGGTYVLDRWVSNTNGALASPAGLSIQQSTTAPSGFINSMLLSTTSGTTASSTQFAAFGHYIEGVNSYDLGFGTSSAKTITISFWVRSSVTGTYGVRIGNDANDRSYVSTYSISTANTWEQKSITVPGDTSGTWLTNNGIGIKLQFDLGSGSSNQTSAGSWQSGNYYTTSSQADWIGTSSATFYITGVQLEVGSVATEFERRPYGTELALCQRYLFVVKGSESSDGYCRFVQGDIESGTNFTSGYTLPVRMRVTPTVTTTGTASNYAIYSGGVVTACNSVPTINSGNPQTICVTATAASGLTTGRGATIIANNNNTAYLYYGAEL